MKRLLPLCLLILLAIACRAVDPVTERWPNGFRLLVHPTTASQVVSVELLLDFSAFDEPTALQGIRQIVMSSMLQGSPGNGGDEIQRKLTAAGGILEGRVHQEMLEFTVTVPADALPTGLAALAEIVCRPAMTDDGILQAIDNARDTLADQPDSALENTQELAHNLLYAGHPFASRALGTEESLAQLTPVMVRAAYRAYVSPANAVMAIVGRCDPTAISAQVRAHFGLWDGPPHAERPVYDNPSLTESQLELREQPVNATCVMLTFPVCGATHPDFLTLRVIDSLLSGGTGSRLFRVVREQRHLAYEVKTVFPSQGACSDFSLYALTRNNYLEDTKSALVTELARLQTEPVSDSELQRAKAYLKGRYLLSHQYSAQYAFDLAWYTLLGLGADYDRTLATRIDAVTAHDIQRVARRYFTHYYLIVVLPQFLKVG